jgi:hypothetical protein
MSDIDIVKRKITAVEQKIAAVEQLIAAAAFAILTFADYENEEEKRRKIVRLNFAAVPGLKMYYGYSEAKLQDTVKQLQDEKKQLQDEKKQLQENENLLLAQRQGE